MIDNLYKLKKDDVDMKILFLHPPWPGKGYGLRSQNRWPRKRGDKTNRYPILLCYVATLLKKNGYIVKYIDAVYQDFNEKQCLGEIGKLSPDVIFIETSTPTFDYDVYFVSLIKKYFPQIKILMAGSHVTYAPIESIKKSKVDVVIKGEMDFITLNVINALKNKESLSNIKGVCYKSHEKIIDNPPVDLTNDLDSLPFPDRDLIPHQWYIEGHARKSPFTFVMGARGCPHNCSFCLWPNIYYNHRVRFRSPKNIVDELVWLIRKYGMKEVFFDEGTFNTSKKRVIGVCQEIISRRIKIIWSCSCRVDIVDLEMLKWMKRAGCKLICYGGESANTKTLKFTNKRIKIEQIKKAVKLTKKSGIICHMNFMVGFPWETEEDVQKTINFSLKLKPDTVQFSMVFPHPGSRMYEEAKQKNWFYKGVLSNLHVFDMTQGPVVKSLVPRAKMMKIINKAHARFFLRPGYILGQFLNIRSFDDIKVLLKGARSVLKGKIFFK